MWPVASQTGSWHLRHAKCPRRAKIPMPTAISLFSGCGGSDKGLVNAGYQVVMANDILRYAKDVYEANLPETDFQFGDIAQITKFPAADVLAGCYPCQGFSQGGAREANRKINGLYEEFGRALWEIHPKAFIVENVPGMARSNNSHLLKSQLDAFKAAGYEIATPRVINGAEYGLPQERRRIFIVGIRSDLRANYQFPQPTHGPKRKPFTTQRHCISETDGTWPQGEFYDKDFHWYYLSRDRHRGWESPSKTVLANARHMPLHPMSPPLIKVGADQWQFNGNAADARRLSYKEAAILQDLAGWEFPETANLMSKYKVIGNAVPPILFQRIVEALPQEVHHA